MPQSKIDTKNPQPSTDATEPQGASTMHEGEPIASTLTASLHPLTLSSALDPALPLATARRDGAPARRSPRPAHERRRGGSQAYGPGRRFNSRHRG